MTDEFDNFMEKVTQVEKLLKQMGSSDKQESQRAQRQADVLLKGNGKREDLDKVEVQPGGLYCRTNRTVINQRAFEKLGKSEDPAEMSKEAFMAQVEKDAENRARDRRERKQRSDEFKVKANKAFRAKEFEKALDLFNKAIDEARDSVVLYENRALTCLHLDLNQKAVQDCDLALRLNENSLKALLYKARACHRLGEQGKSDKCMVEAMKKHPQHEKLLKEFEELWFGNKKREDP